MIVKPFPLCCGAYILTDFGNTDESMGTSSRLSTSSVLSFISQAIKDYYRSAFLIAILNEEQHDVLGSTFEEAGFERVTEGYTPNYSYDLHLYVWSST